MAGCSGRESDGERRRMRDYPRRSAIPDGARSGARHERRPRQCRFHRRVHRIHRSESSGSNSVTARIGGRHGGGTGADADHPRRQSRFQCPGRHSFRRPARQRALHRTFGFVLGRNIQRLSMAHPRNSLPGSLERRSRLRRNHHHHAAADRAPVQGQQIGARTAGGHDGRT